MAKYVFPALFTKEESGLYAVDFPDLESCYTCGDDLPDAIHMAEDVLALTLYNYEKDGKEIPAPSSPRDIPTEENEFVSVISADTLYYQKKFSHKYVKKTLTIPEWLNDIAISANINFSKTLQEALAEKLHVQI